MTTGRSNCSTKIKLPVSMEDEELFPRGRFGINDHSPFDQPIFQEMWTSLDKVWWSRLVTAVRGYVVNDFKEDESLTFNFDDAFIYLHRCLVEGGRDDSLKTLRDLEILESEGTEALQSLQDGYSVPDSKDPFKKQRTAGSFGRIFGAPNPETYAKAFKQGFCYLVFFGIFCKLQSRWRAQTKKVKSVTFQEDAEWQPDSRVVIFHQFHQGNRTWVLTDYDRHIIFFWRPHGVTVIFGERYVQLKLSEGFRLCTYCGLLESVKGEFMICSRCLAQHRTAADACFYCSRGCEDMHWSKHRAEHQI